MTPTDLQFRYAFAKAFRELRENKGLDQREASKVLDLSQPAISQYENGLRSPSLQSAIEICEKLGVELADFVKRIKANVPD